MYAFSCHARIFYSFICLSAKTKFYICIWQTCSEAWGVPAMMEADADKKRFKKTKTYKYYENIFSINYGWSDGCNVCLCARRSRLGML